MKKKYSKLFKFKGDAFTLIELLAVIIILAVVALIATPLILDVIEDANESANMSEAYLILNGAENLYASSKLTGLDKDFNGKSNIYDSIKTSGKKPDDGNVIIKEDGSISLAIFSDNKCYKKEYVAREIFIAYEITDVNDCIPTRDIDVTFEPTATDEWFKDLSIDVTVKDETGDVFYCVSNTPCLPDELVTGSVDLDASGNSVTVCVKVLNSTVTCSDGYKIDKEGPEITGIETIVRATNATIDLMEGVSAYDTLSEENVSVTVNPTSVDTTTTGSKIVTYKATDNLGNETLIERTIIIGNVPTVTFDPLGGSTWLSSNTIVNVTVTTTGEVTASNIKYCTTSLANCTPNESVGNNFQITLTESGGSNIVCVGLDSNVGNGIEYCSDTYKIDKVSPTITAKSGTVTITEEILI